MMPSDLVIVFDSNVLIPLVIPASRSARLFARLQAVAPTPKTTRSSLDRLGVPRTTGKQH